MKYFWRKNKIAIIIAVLVLLTPFFSTAKRDNDYQDERMEANDYVIDASLNDRGDLTINERITVSFSEGMSVLFRDIVYGKNDGGYANNKSRLDYDSVQVKIYDYRNKKIFDSDNPSFYPGTQVGYSYNGDYDELGELIACPAEYGRDCASIFARVKKGTYPRTTYEYTYSILNAATIYEDVAELNWKFGISAASFPIRNARVTLRYPSAVTDTEDVYFYGHSSTNGELQSLTVTEATFGTSVIRPNETLEARILLPANLFVNASGSNVIAEKGLNKLLDAEAQIAEGDKRVYRVNAIAISLIVVIIGGALILFLYFYKKYDRELTPRFQGEYYRDIPADYGPATMSYLYNFKDLTKNDVSATLLDLIVRGYVSIDLNGASTIDRRANYRLTLTDKDQGDLSDAEKALLDWFFLRIAKDKKSITLNELANYPRRADNAARYADDNAKWIAAAKKEGEKRDFFDKKSENLAKSSGWIPFLLLLFGIGIFFSQRSGDYYYSLAFAGASAFAVGIVMSSYLKSVCRRSANGAEEYAKWKALRQYLVDFGKFDDDGIPSLVLWEKYLVYATSFGIADLVEKQMRFKFKKYDVPPETYQAFPLFRYPYFYSYYTMRTINMLNVAQATIAREKGKNISQSVGRGGRGGFGGGSSFGGGGGGFRGR